MDFCEILITLQPISIPSPVDPPHSAGAVVDFFGVVRPEEDGRAISGLDYEAHPRMAERELRAIVDEAAQNPDLRACRLVHRIGHVAAGEISLFLRIVSPHREEAYALSRSLVQTLKKRVPIWKRPIFASVEA